MKTSSKQYKLTLEEVAANFARWRGKKTGNTRIPEELCAQVKLLLSACPKHSPVLRKLGLSKKQAINKGLLATDKTVCLESSLPNPFIQIPLPQTIPSPEFINIASVVPNKSSTQSTTAITLKRGDVALLFNATSDLQLQLIINTFIR